MHPGLTNYSKCLQNIGKTWKYKVHRNNLQAKFFGGNCLNGFGKSALQEKINSKSPRLVQLTSNKRLSRFSGIKVEKTSETFDSSKDPVYAYGAIIWFENINSLSLPLSGCNHISDRASLKTRQATVYNIAIVHFKRNIMIGYATHVKKGKRRPHWSDETCSWSFSWLTYELNEDF